MLEGNEIEKEYDGGSGKLTLDVTEKGEIIFSNTYEKELNGYAKVKSVTQIESNIFRAAYIATLKTKATWDEKVVEGIAKLIGVDLGNGQAAAIAESVKVA